MKRKYIILMVLISGCMIALSGFGIIAESQQNFAGTTRGDSWQRVSQGTIKKTTSGNPWIDWNYSEFGNSHKQWFTIVPKDKSNGVGEVRLDGYGRSDITNHSSGKGNSYYLKSKREHFPDPATYVSGNWSPN